METADVIIIGAGINGVSTAFHLAQAGVRRVVVVERQHIAAGATGKSGALVRTHYANEAETRLAIESLRYFQHWDDLVGGDPGFRPVGLFVLPPPAAYEKVVANVAMHRRLGANAHVLTAAEARDLDPTMAIDDLSHVAYEPDSGYADPNAAAYAFARAAEDRGVRFRFNTQVQAILTDGSRVLGVETSQGRILSSTVVVIAGAWANQLFAPLGLDFGLLPAIIRVAIFRPAYQRPDRQFTYIDLINHSWIRPFDSGSTLIGAEDDVSHAANLAHFTESVEQPYLDHCHQVLSRRFPIMQASTTRGNWAGILMRSPDSRPIIDQIPQYQGLFTMTGDSGTSFKTAPAIGKGLAEWITTGAPQTIDLYPFRASRFAEPNPWNDATDYRTSRATVSR